METSIDWIYDLEDEYKNQTSNEVIITPPINRVNFIS